MAEKQQTFANHARFDPPFHFFIAPVVLISIIAAAVNLFRFPSLGSAWLLVVSLAAITAVLRIRIYALRVQDRVIRLEERLRLRSVLPSPLCSRIEELTETQLIGLRFASDTELAVLAERAMNEKLDRAAIKKSISDWRPDYSRV